MLRSAVTISGAPTVIVGGVEKAWYNTFTIYVTARNTVSGALRMAHSTFKMGFINTDPSIDQPPTLNVPDQTLDEGDALSLNLTDYTTGTPPFTYERTLRTESARFPLPDWENFGTGGSGVDLSSAGMLTGTAPEIDGGDIEGTAYITARNSVGVGNDRFTITVEDGGVNPHINPEWDIGNKRYVATEDTANINPIGDGEVEGTPPITITLTDATANPLPSWLSLSNNVLSGSPQLGDVGVSTIALTATNTNKRGTSYSSDATFTITVIAPRDVNHREPVWDIGNKRYVATQDTADIDPIGDGEVEGTPPITITLTDCLLYTSPSPRD